MLKNEKINITLQLDNEEIEKLAIGRILLVSLGWWSNNGSTSGVLKSDKETKDILIKEKDLMRLIQLVTPWQPDRHIRLV